MPKRIALIFGFILLLPEMAFPQVLRSETTKIDMTELSNIASKLRQVNLDNIDLQISTETSTEMLKSILISSLPPGVTILEFKKFHHNRNLLQKNLKYEQVASGNYGGIEFELLTPEKSVYHQIGKYNAGNVKYVGSDGSEYVFRPTKQSDGRIVYDQVTDPVNVGTYNVVNAGVSGVEHTIWDIIPWVLWGNTPAEELDPVATNWRKQLFIASALVAANRAVEEKSRDFDILKRFLGLEISNPINRFLADQFSNSADRGLENWYNELVNNCNCNNTDYNNNGKGDFGTKEPLTNSNVPFVAFLSYFTNWTQPNGQGGTYTGIYEGHKGVLFEKNEPAPATGVVSFKSFDPTDELTVNSVKTPQPANGDNLQEANRYGPGVFRNLVNWDYGVAGTNYDQTNYSYAAWGRWNGTIRESFDSGTVETSDRGYWVGGRYSASPVIDARTGTASYKGALIGDFLAKGTSTIETGVAYGKIDLDMDFASNTLVGGMNIFLNRSGTTTSWLNPAITDGQISPYLEEHGQVVGPVFMGDVGDQSGFQNDDGPGLVGFFFGPNGEEVGGAFDAYKDTGTEAGTVNGVFRALEQAP